MKPWTDTERRTLKRMSKTSTAKEIAAALDRTPNAVHQQAYKLKVRLQKAGDRDYRTKYPDALVERIRAMHEGGGTPTTIARATGVPLGSVKAFVYYRQREEASLVLSRGST